MKYTLFACVIIFLLSSNIFSQKITVLESDMDKIHVEVDFGGVYTIRDTVVNGINYKYISSPDPILRENGNPAIPEYYFSLGIPRESNPAASVKILQKEVLGNYNIIPFYSVSEDEESFQHEYSQDTYNKNSLFPEKQITLHDDFIFRYSRILPVSVTPFQYNPVSRELIFNRIIEIKLIYNPKDFEISIPVKDDYSEEFLRYNILNYESAKNWISKPSYNSPAFADSFWYNPTADYYKIYLKEKGVYRVTFQDMINAGASVDGIAVEKFQMFNEGQPVPIEVVDNGDGLFNAGDYIQFVGFPPKSSPYSYFNIYNRNNVYWLTYENNFSPVRYVNTDGYPQSWTSTIQSTVHTLHYEVDSLYERLGQSSGGNRDFWFWGTSSGINGTLTKVFSTQFNSLENWSDSLRIVLRVGMHGMTNGPVFPDHKVKVMVTSQLVDSIQWDGQTDIVFEKSIMVGQDLNFYPVNTLQIVADGNIPRDPSQPNSNPVDEIRVNWFEIDYWKNHRTINENMIFKNRSTRFGANTYSIWNWTAADMKIYIPSKSNLITNPRYLGDTYHEYLFRDTTYSDTEYFIVSSNSYLIPDSIKRNNPSDLRNPDNGADYIIITHEKFRDASERLADYRRSNLKGFENPRVKVVDVNSIYNEFSAGLLDPYSLREFVKYAFENWAAPAPRYVVLVGDMSYDYRKLLQSTRQNYIPSIPFQQTKYGQAVADNNIVAVAGNDLVPDLAIGRISCETVEEANILVDKIINYPADPGKAWKENVLLIGAGQSNSDENQFGFNYENVLLEQSYIKNNGFTTTKVFRYPNRPEHMPFLGEGPQIRAGFNSGAAVANFYGHGGGYQWDLVFLNDDIFLLENQNRLPFITSVTCYTAHFDNQDVFGEQFNKVPGKGSIAFWGSTGLTYWSPAVTINKNLYNQLFSNSKYVIGDAILSAKIQSASSYYLILEHIALLTLLGDPALELALPYYPDFNVTPSNISFSPSFPLVDDTLIVNVDLTNYGRTFPGDSVKITITVTFLDSVKTTESIYVQNFGQSASLQFYFLPEEQGYYNFSVSINDDLALMEEDHDDNTAVMTTLIYNLKEPSIIKPNNGFVMAASDAHILLSDVGHYIHKEILYHLQIDTGSEFLNPVINDSLIVPSDGLVDYKLNLPEGKYFWRVRLLNEGIFTKFTSARTFIISAESRSLSTFSGNQMKLFDSDNIVFSDSLKAMVLNTSFLPPKPNNSRWVGAIDVDLPDDILALTAATTDGKYIYYSNMAYYKRPSKIYRLGTGKMGSIKGQDYGAIPNVEVEIWHTMFHHNNFIYVATGDPYSLLQINPENGDTSRVQIPDGMIDESARIKNGAFYLCSDGRYVYNLAHYDSVPNLAYTIRILDPQNNWSVVGSNKRLSGSSYLNFVSFFVADGYVYVYENGWSGFMRRINIETGIYEEEWLSFNPMKGFYSWSFDHHNNAVYASVWFRDSAPQFYEFIGRYKKSAGSLTVTDVGPASSWSNVSYNIEQHGDFSDYSVLLKGKNHISGQWDTLAVELPASLQINEIDAELYPYLGVEVQMIDTSFSQLIQ
jgi:hypothetical protein